MLSPYNLGRTPPKPEGLTLRGRGVIVKIPMDHFQTPYPYPLEILFQLDPYFPWLPEAIPNDNCPKFKREEILKSPFRDVSSCPVVKISPSSASVGLIPGQAAKIPHDLWPKTQTKTEAIL